MLTEERYNIILELLREKRSVTVAEIKDRLGISESTIRRDLNALAPSLSTQISLFTSIIYSFLLQAETVTPQPVPVKM